MKPTVAMQSGAGTGPGTYKLVAQYPRRVIGLGALGPGATLADAGLTSRQEALLLEPLPQPEPHPAADAIATLS